MTGPEQLERKGELTGNEGMGLLSESKENGQLEPYLFRALLQSFPEAVVAAGMDGRIILANEHVQSIFGCEGSHLLNKELDRLQRFCTGPVQMLFNALAETLAGDVCQAGLREVCLPGQDKKWVEVESRILRGAGNPGQTGNPGETCGALVVAREAAWPSRLKENFNRTEGLALAGQLAAGIAHEVRNPLTSIRGFVQLLSLKLEKESRLQRYARIILDEVDRASKILADFLDLTHHNTPQFYPCGPEGLINDVMALVDSEAFLRQVLVRKECENGLPLVLADKRQIRQVLLNLAVNGLAAMPDGGELVFRIRSAEAEIEGQEAVVIEVEDTGCGMDEATLSQIGKPFFTTKEGGTGLGLMISKRIMEDHQGILKFRSTPGRGCCVTMVLPAALDHLPGIV